MVLLLLLLSWLQVRVYHASGVTSKPRVFVRLSKLIGGPSALRLHSAVFVEQGDALVGFDFVPLDATNPATVTRLLSLRSAPGAVRELHLSDSRGLLDLGPASLRADELRDLARGDANLHLLWNQCWTHSLRLASAATGREPLALIADLLRSSLKNAFKEEVERPYAPAQKDDDKVERAFREEKVRHFASPKSLVDLLADEDRQRVSESAKEFEAALRQAEADSNNKKRRR